MATIGLSPFISAIRARQPGQRLRWSCNRSRRPSPSALARYAWKSCRNSAQNLPERLNAVPWDPSERPNAVPWVALPALATFCQTRARASSTVPESTSSSLISCSARSRRSSDIADLLLNLLPLHLRLQPVPDPVEPDGHVVLLHLEQPGQIFDRQPLDVTQQEQACVLAVQGGEAASKPLLQQKRW